MSGWIKLHRQITDWEWFKEHDTLALFIYLLVKANHKDGRWQGLEIKRGQLITGRKSLAANCHMSERKVRTSLERLKNAQQITMETTNKYTLITLINYELYQSEGEEATSKRPAERPTSDQQTTSKRPANDHKQECKNNKNEKKEIIISSNKYSDDHEKFATGMYSLIKKVAPATKQPNIEKWSNDIRLMNKTDKLDLHEMANVFRWANSDSFWKTNILSPSKFRKQYSKLHAKWLEETGRGTSSFDSFGGISGSSTSGYQPKPFPKDDDDGEIYEHE